MEVRVNKQVAKENGADFVIFDSRMLPSDDIDKVYEFTIGHLPWNKTIFWRRWLSTFSLVSLLIYIFFFGQGAIELFE